MDQIQHNVNQLTGAINAQIEQFKIFEARLTALEQKNNQGGIIEARLLALEGAHAQRHAARSDVAIPIPRNEEELDSVKKLPDRVRDVQVFEGCPTQYISWIHNVESVLKDYEIVVEKPIFGAIIRHIRQEIRGAADNALVSYNIFDIDWETIKNILSLHCAKKKKNSATEKSLENQLITLKQGKNFIDVFYNKFNQQLSLIINKIKMDDYSIDGANTLIENYRYRASDVFIRGLQSDLCHLIKVKKPQTLPEAYTTCLDLLNMDFRKNIENRSNDVQRNLSNPQNNTGRLFTNQIPLPNIQPRNTPIPYNNQNFRNTQMISPLPNNIPPPPKPPTPMEIDQSIRSARVNYINRPTPVLRPSNESSNIPRKYQRVYNIEPIEETGLDQAEHDEQLSEENFEETEENFMTKASPLSTT